MSIERNGVVCGEIEKLPQRSCHISCATATNLVIITITIASTIIIAKSHRPIIDVVIIIDVFAVIIIIDIVVDGMGWDTALWSTFWVSPRHPPYPHHPSATPTVPLAPGSISALLTPCGPGRKKWGPE
jgi:hypothetical protein